MYGFVLFYWCVALLCGALSALWILQTCEHWRYVRGRVRGAKRYAWDPHLAVFVPCKGTDEDLETNLRPLFEQDHADYELVFVVESEGDAAFGEIDRLIAQYPHIAAKIVVAGVTTAEGQKVHNLLAATRELNPRTDALVFVDADVRPAPDWLDQLTERLDHCAAATGYRWFVPKRPSLANHLLSSINASMVPFMFPGRHNKVWGGSWAVRRDVFEEMKLRDAWRGTLSDDLVAGHVLAQSKARIAMEPTCIVPSPVDVDMRAMFSFIRRQYLIGRVYAPRLWMIAFAHALLSQLFLWGSAVAAAWGLASGAAWTWQPLTATVTFYGLHVVRGVLRQRAARHFPISECKELAAWRRFDIWCWPLAALAAFSGLISSALGGRIVWRGICYEMGRGGQIRRITWPSQEVWAPAVERDLNPAGQQVAA
ncbi:MAG TPA: glycosyltransferase [Pirellulales bacterium]|nr:glycosyltransferase [Pirellulales bacterium]